MSAAYRMTRPQTERTERSRSRSRSRSREREQQQAEPMPAAAAAATTMFSDATAAAVVTARPRAIAVRISGPAVSSTTPRAAQTPAPLTPPMVAEQKTTPFANLGLVEGQDDAQTLSEVLAIATRTIPAAAAASSGVDRVKHPSGIVPNVENVVATSHLGTQLNLPQLALQLRNAEYNPKRFAALTVRLSEPKTTALVFKTGKMVVTGAHSIGQSRLATRKFVRLLQLVGVDAQFSDFTVQNIVSSADVGFRLRLEGFAQEHDEFAMLEPQIFPGLVYRMVSPKVVLLIFESGKVVITGAKELDRVYEAFESLYPVLEEFRKN